MKLRVRFEGDGSSRVIELPDDASLLALLSLIDPVRVESIRVGRDGAPLDTSEPSKPLRELGIKNLDTLFVKQTSVAAKSPIEMVAPASGLGAEEPGMVIRHIADDNSCLFNAVAYTLATQPLYTSAQLRTIVADCILSNPTHFNKVLLEQLPEDYVQWILWRTLGVVPSSWES